MPPPDDHAAQRLGKPYRDLDQRTQKVARHIAERKHIARNLVTDPASAPTRGQRAADAVASFGGSWTFVGLFGAAMLAWVGLNALLLVRQGSTFDPYPYILLNLFLSMLAAIQAPVPNNPALTMAQTTMKPLNSMMKVHEPPNAAT